jgi:O-antigen/teichoic acid export membrane protein
MIARNALWNLAGFGLPLFVAVACIPPLIHALGAPRFGLLTLLWAVINYFGLFDMGLGRALTHRLSAAMGSGREEEIAPVARDGLTLLAALGMVAGIVLWVAAPYGVALLALEGSPAEAVGALRSLAWAMPFVLLTSGLRGVMEARGAFVPINIVRLATGVATVLAPLLVVQAGWNDLVVVAWTLGALRGLGCLAYAWCVGRMLPGALAATRPRGARLGPLLRTGGWMTVANIIGPLMGYLDRFVIGAVGSMSAVAWYVTPQEIVSRLLIVPVSLASVLFPRLSELHASTGERMVAWPLERLALGVLFVALQPVTLVLGTFAHPILERWVGPEFAREGSTAMLILCAGVLANGLAHVPFASIQARGNARATALLQMIELPIYVAAMWMLASLWGVVGAALAWTARILVDLAALWLMARPDEVSPADRAGDSVALVVGLLTLAAFGCAAFAPPSWAAAGSLAIGALAWVMAAMRLRGDVPRLVAARKADGLPR